jgi:hypothetical protein
MTPNQSETKPKNTRSSEMKKHDNNEDLGSIADLVHRQGVFLEVLIHRLAAVEATVLMLAIHTLPDDESFRMVKEFEGDILSKIHKRLATKLDHNLDDL